METVIFLDFEGMQCPSILSVGNNHPHGDTHFSKTLLALYTFQTANSIYLYHCYACQTFSNSHARRYRNSDAFKFIQTTIASYDLAYSNAPIKNHGGHDAQEYEVKIRSLKSIHTVFHPERKELLFFLLFLGRSIGEKDRFECFLNQRRRSTSRNWLNTKR